MNDRDIAESLKRLHAPAPPAKWQETLFSLLGYAGTPIFYVGYFCFGRAWNGTYAGSDGSYATLLALAAASIALIVCLVASERYSAVGRYSRSLFIAACGMSMFAVVLAITVGTCSK